MTTRSGFDSVRFGIATADHKLARIFLIIGMVMWLGWLAPATQFLYFYFEYGQTDSDPVLFFFLMPLLFIPVLLTGGIIFSALILRLRIGQWMKRLVTYAEYEPKFTPAEMGLLLDYSYDKKELYATLLKLHFENRIKLHAAAGTLDYTVLDTSTQNLSLLEAAIIKAAATTTTAERAVQKVLPEVQANMDQRGYFVEFGLDSRIIRRASAYLGPIILIAVGVTFLVLVMFIFNFEESTRLTYPRYDVTSSQLWLLALSLMAGLITLLTGFFPRLKTDAKTSSAATWMHVAGWYHYLEKVYVDRFSSRHIYTQNPAEIKKILPYLVAFGLFDLETVDVNKLLRIVGEA